MRFKPYPKYKPSGVEWLGEVPDGWEVKRLGHFFHERREKVSDKDYAPLSVTKNGIVPQLETAAKTDDGDNRKLVLSGDLVINSRSDRKGSSGVSSLDGSVSLINTVLEPISIEPSFAHHLVRSYPFQEEFYRYGKGIVADLWSTNYSEMRNISLSVPARVEQSAIAAFLDRETSKIETLISKQEKLIELLKEKRQVIISHAVTKGLNPKVKMKDSGIEWLGEVPEHWDVKPIKYFGRLKGGAGFPHDEQGLEGEELPFYKVYALGQASPKGVLGPSENTISRETAERLRAYIFPPGSIVFAKVGAALLLGRVRTISVPSCIDNNMMGLMVNQYTDVGFIQNAMSLIKFDLIANPGAVPSLNETQIGDFQIAAPLYMEQQTITDFLERETAKIDKLISNSEKAIELQREHRTALISAAVTGKIDVRNMVNGL